MEKKVLYFSAEWGLAGKNIPIYAGGLGILAGDALAEAARLGWPWVGLGLMYHEGFFEQKISTSGEQTESHPHIKPEDYGLQVVKSRPNHPLVVVVPFPGRQIFLKIWQLKMGAANLYLLDANLPENTPEDRRLTSRLYTGNWNLQLAQEVLLGVGGVEAARALNLEVNVWHLNDDHAAFSLLWRLKGVHSSIEDPSDLAGALEEVQKNSVFTTHTPMKGSESVFDQPTVMPYLTALFGTKSSEKVYKLGEFTNNPENKSLFSLTVATMKLTHARNAVSERHNEVAKKLWNFIWPECKEGDVPIRAVTNGVNAANWTNNHFTKLYNKYLGADWLARVDDPSIWQKAETIPDKEIWHSRLESKKTLLGFLGRHHAFKTPPAADSFFIGYARRFTAYKQPGVLLDDLNHLRALLTNNEKPVYLILAGKANPMDPAGKEMVKKAILMDRDPALGERIVFLTDYDLEIAKNLVSGVDLWVNTPVPPWEACGTSGMKAVYNGVLNASTFDGWWYEAYDASLGWVIGPADKEDSQKLNELTTSDALFFLLESEIVPLFYNRIKGVPVEWVGKIKQAMLKLAPRYNSARMLKEYREKIYG